MKTWIIIAFSIALLISCGKNTPDQEIDHAMQKFMKAAIAGEGATAAETLTSESFDFWSSLIKKADSLDKEELKELNLYEQASVILLRARFGKDDLKQMDGRKYLVLSYSRGWNSTNSLKKVYDVYPDCKKTVSIMGNKAILRLTYKGQPLKDHFAFKFESGRWRVDALDAYQQIEKRAQEIFNNSGENEAEFIEKLVSNAIGQPFDPDWWNPEPK